MRASVIWRVVCAATRGLTASAALVLLQLEHGHTA